MEVSALIELKNVTKKFDKLEAVHNLSLRLEKGKITMFIGPSGCGKTTTLKMINRLIEPDEGDILVNGRSVFEQEPVALRRSIGYVIQDVGLLPHYSVFDNIALVPRLLKWDEKRIEARVDELLDLVTLNASYAEKYPLQLSGGEQQRVGLARALAADPDILLMDEPFGAIDPINRSKLQDSFLEIQETIQKTIIFVTHDINEAITLGDHIAIMNAGHLVQYGDPNEILQNPKDDFVQHLLGADRNLKALSLEKIRDYLDEDAYLTVASGTNPENIKQKLRTTNRRLALAVDENGSLQGRYDLEQSSTHGDGGKLSYDPQPVVMSRNNNLIEALSMMLETGENQLPVVTSKGKLRGVIRLTHIFAKVEAAKAGKNIL
jgi:osmoprotectant transport system ATP-binding protein